MSNLDIIRGRQVVLPLTNKSGAQRIEGEVVVADVTTDDSFTTTVAEGNDLVIGVVAETIANNAEGRVICAGWVATVEVDAATVRGDYLKTSTTAGEATPTATFDVGVFAIALSAVGGAGDVSAYLFGVDGSAGGGGAWELIEDVELGAPAATIDFVGIAATYKHLVLLYSLSTSQAATIDGLRMRFNNSAVGYDWVRVAHNAAAAAAGTEALNSTFMELCYLIPDSASPAGSFGEGTISVNDYTDTGKLPGAVLHGGFLRDRVATQIYVGHGYGQWRTAAAVNRITIYPSVGPNWVTGSRISLYGIN